MRLKKVKAGRKGNLNVATEVCDKLKMKLINTARVHSFCGVNSLFYQIFQMAPSLHMVEVRKAKGDTLEFHKVLLPWMILLPATLAVA